MKMSKSVVAVTTAIMTVAVATSCGKKKKESTTTETLAGCFLIGA